MALFNADSYQEAARLLTVTLKYDGHGGGRNVAHPSAIMGRGAIVYCVH